MIFSMLTIYFKLLRIIIVLFNNCKNGLRLLISKKQNIYFILSDIQYLLIFKNIGNEISLNQKYRKIIGIVSY